MTRTAPRTVAAVSTALLATALTGLSASPALASGDDDDVLRTGSCSARSDWKLKAGPDDGRLEVELEVDSDVAGQTWRWSLSRNGTRFASGTATTTRPSGSFEVERRTGDRPGVDAVAFRATNPRTGEVCRGSLRV